MPNPSQTGAANGLLPAPSSILQKNATPSATRGGPRNTPPKPKLKFCIRRLPPGLTKAELEEALGGEWKPGNGKVDWSNFRKGRTSTDLSKTSRPARCFLHLTDASHVTALQDKVKQTPFVDAKNTGKDPVLIAPPSLEHALYARIPTGRRVRHDARQGQIDQDPEYQDFLMSLTNPVNKPSASDTSDLSAQKNEKVTTTPLIEHLREKKAAKEKPGSKTPKHSRGESKEDKSDRKAKPGKDGASAEKPKKLSRKEAAKEAVKVLNKEAVGSSGGPKSQENAPPSGSTTEKKRERGSTAAAKALLQRDLGIGPAVVRGRRGAKRETTAESVAKSGEPTEVLKEKEALATAQASDKPAAQADSTRASKEKGRFSRAERRAHKAAIAENKDRVEQSVDDAAKIKTPVAPTILRKPAGTPTPAATPASPPTGPKVLSAPPKGPLASRQAPPAAVGTVAQATVPTPTSTVKQGFLKHANPSQGITEPLIETALSAFGTVEKVEIDKRKGFAYVEFAEPEGLQKAIAASPIKIAQGAVQVLERKDRPAKRVVPTPVMTGPPTAPRGNIVRGGGFAGRGRGGGRGGIIGRGGRGPQAFHPAQGASTPVGDGQVLPASAPNPKSTEPNTATPAVAPTSTDPAP